MKELRTDYCNEHTNKYGLCGYTHMTFYPTRAVKEDIEALLYHRDIPIIIDGNENESYYKALLREFANIPTKRASLDIKDRFNLLPIFICPAIQSSFKNVINMDLTDISVSEAYLNLIRKNKQLLTSWVLELVINCKDYFPSLLEFQDNNKDRFIFGRKINANINHMRTKYTELTKINAINVGIMSFFFKGYMDVLKNHSLFPFQKNLN